MGVVVENRLLQAALLRSATAGQHSKVDLLYPAAVKSVTLPPYGSPPGSGRQQHRHGGSSSTSSSSSGSLLSTSTVTKQGTGGQLLIHPTNMPSDTSSSSSTSTTSSSSSSSRHDQSGTLQNRDNGLPTTAQLTTQVAVADEQPAGSTSTNMLTAATTISSSSTSSSSTTPLAAASKGAKGATADGSSSSTRASSQNRLAKITLSDGRTLRCRLIVGADGARSQIRDLAGFRTIGWSYNQRGVVATVSTTQPSATAWQRFLPTGPLALLPARDGYSSIVWSTSPDMAKQLEEMNSQQFAGEGY